MSALTTEFYRRVAPSFAATRQSAWRGWDELLEVANVKEGAHVRVLDVACGNLRFERFMGERGIDARTWAYDNCDELVQGAAMREVSAATAASGDGKDAELAQETPRSSILYRSCDLTDVLMGERPMPGSDELACDLCVSFGFMHHLPLLAQRERLLGLLVRAARAGGHVAVTFWQFADDARLRAKARHVEGGGKNDYLLGWQDVPGVWRFCHHTPEAEIDELVRSVAGVAREVARYSADGRSGRLNRYLVLEATGDATQRQLAPA